MDIQPEEPLKGVLRVIGFDGVAVDSKPGVSVETGPNPLIVLSPSKDLTARDALAYVEIVGWQYKSVHGGSFKGDWKGSPYAVLILNSRRVVTSRVGHT